MQSDYGWLHNLPTLQLLQVSIQILLRLLTCQAYNIYPTLLCELVWGEKVVLTLIIPGFQSLEKHGYDSAWIQKIQNLREYLRVFGSIDSPQHDKFRYYSASLNQGRCFVSCIVVGDNAQPQFSILQISSC
jgi:hypothetical protein